MVGWAYAYHRVCVGLRMVLSLPYGFQVVRLGSKYLCVLSRVTSPVCVWVNTHWHVRGTEHGWRRGRLARVSSPSTTWFPRDQTQAWWQAPLPAEPSWQSCSLFRRWSYALCVFVWMFPSFSVCTLELVHIWVCFFVCVHVLCVCGLVLPHKCLRFLLPSCPFPPFLFCCGCSKCDVFIFLY